jgi:ribonuclease HII
MLKSCYNESNQLEIGVDECARGPMFGRLYTAAVVLPKIFDHSKMKDSKKIKSRTTMKTLADYIKENAISWSVDFIEPKEIDEINIRQAVLKCMRTSIQNVIEKMNNNDVFLVIDGNDFIPMSYNGLQLNHVCVEKGDNTYSFIAAASILAKYEHDKYILELCEQYPELENRYGLKTNVGYGTKKHLDGIREHGISQWHRRSYGCCKTAPINQL